MAHIRSRLALSQLQKLAKLWPVVGLIGPRQSGKTTLFTKLLGLNSEYSLDELENRNEAQNSPTTFLAKLTYPAVIDEIQKSPNLFDAIKLHVDRNRRPGQFFLTGSTTFSSK